MFDLRQQLELSDVLLARHGMSFFVARSLSRIRGSCRARRQSLARDLHAVKLPVARCATSKIDPEIAMSMMERWEPIREMMTLREAMDRLFQDSYVRPVQMMGTGERSWMPMDVSERDDSYEICAPLAGIKPEDVHISMEDQVLTIHAESKEEQERQDKQWLMRERQQTTYHRSIRLPSPVSPDEARAEFENGVLTITLPKAPEARPRQIPISGSQRTGGNGHAIPPSATSTSSETSKSEQPREAGVRQTPQSGAGPS